VQTNILQGLGSKSEQLFFCDFVCFAALSIILSILTEFQVFAELHKTTCAKKYSKQSELPLEFIRFGKKIGTHFEKYAVY